MIFKIKGIHILGEHLSRQVVATPMSLFLIGNDIAIMVFFCFVFFFT